MGPEEFSWSIRTEEKCQEGDFSMINDTYKTWCAVEKDLCHYWGPPILMLTGCSAAEHVATADTWMYHVYLHIWKSWSIFSWLEGRHFLWPLLLLGLSYDENILVIYRCKVGNAVRLSDDQNLWKKFFPRLVGRLYATLPTSKEHFLLSRWEWKYYFLSQRIRITFECSLQKAVSWYRWQFFIKLIFAFISTLFPCTNM